MTNISPRNNLKLAVTKITRRKFCRDFERLDLAKMFQKTGAYKAVRKAISEWDANKYVKVHDRRNVLVGFIASVLVGASKTSGIVEYARAMASYLSVESFS